MQKPPKLNKLSKKQLKKLYTVQWNANNELAWENARLEILYKVAKNQIDTLEQAIQSAESALVYKEWEIEHKDRLLKSLINS